MRSSALIVPAGRLAASFWNIAPKSRGFWLGGAVVRRTGSAATALSTRAEADAPLSDFGAGDFAQPEATTQDEQRAHDTWRSIHLRLNTGEVALRIGRNAQFETNFVARKSEPRPGP